VGVRVRAAVAAAVFFRKVRRLVLVRDIGLPRVLSN
jgi:hypothetical protein